MKRTIKIHVAGQQYILRSDADEGYVQSLAESVNARINALKGSRQVATQSDVVLAALKLADELSHEQALQKSLRTQTRQHVQRMLDHLNLALSSSSLAPADVTKSAAVAQLEGPVVAAAAVAESKSQRSRKSQGSQSQSGSKSR